MKEMNMTSPWVEYADKLNVFFDKDPDIDVEYVNGDNEDDRYIQIWVEDSRKAEALKKLLPQTKTFGNVSINIYIIDNTDSSESKATLFRTLFDGNDAVRYIQTVSPPFSSNPFTYVVFEKEVVQYWNDNLGDINGLKSTLYQDLAKEIFAEDGESLGGVYFCTSDE